MAVEEGTWQKVGAAAAVVSVLVAVYFGYKSLHPDPGPHPSPGPSTSSPGPSTSSPGPAPHKEGSLFNVPQTPGTRQESGPTTYNGENYPKSFQLDIPAGSTPSYNYNLNSQWSRIDLVIGIPSDGNGAANIKVSIALDGQAVGSKYIIVGSPYSGQFSVAGVSQLTISFDANSSISDSTVLVAGNLFK
jgi:hypothetical protein